MPKQRDIDIFVRQTSANAFAKTPGLPPRQMVANG